MQTDPTQRRGRIKNMHGHHLGREVETDVLTSHERLGRLTDEATKCGAACLIRAVAVSCDRSAFTELFQIYAPRVTTYLMRLGLDRGAADELTQDVMLTLWRKAAQFDAARATPAAWIFTIARNARVDMARRQQRASRPEPVDETAPDLIPDSVLAAADRSDRIAVALAVLPAEQAEVIRLAFFDDRPHAEIERALGIPLGTVKSRLRLALAKLRRLLENDL